MRTRKSPLGTIISCNRSFFIELFDRLADILPPSSLLLFIQSSSRME